MRYRNHSVCGHRGVTKFLVRSSVAMTLFSTLHMPGNRGMCMFPGGPIYDERSPPSKPWDLELETYSLLAVSNFAWL